MHHRSLATIISSGVIGLTGLGSAPAIEYRARPAALENR